MHQGRKGLSLRLSGWIWALAPSQFLSLAGGQILQFWQSSLLLSQRADGLGDYVTGLRGKMMGHLRLV